MTVIGSHHGKATASPADSPTTGPAKQVDAKAEARGETAEHGDHTTPEGCGPNSPASRLGSRGPEGAGVPSSRREIRTR